ncbi:MAG: hypothetical protein IPP73_11740 [Chitinophagaceae bacterium]|nr:hypothetical protein [Chitinophagaceae bacterium]
MSSYKLLFTVAAVFIFSVTRSQNVGIGNPLPSEKLHIDSGNVKIGRTVLNTGQSNLLMFGDGGFVTIGESDADDQMSLTASYFLFRSFGGFGGRVGIGVPSGVPGAQLEVNGNVKITDGQQGVGKVLTSDFFGLASWQQPASGSGAFKALVTSSQNITSSVNSTLIYTTKDYDDVPAFFSTAYFAPSTGLYHFDVCVTWNISPVGFQTQYVTILNVNGSDVHADVKWVPGGSGNFQTQSMSCDVKLVAGDNVSVIVNQSSGILQPVVGTVGTVRYSYFSGRRVN